MAPSWLTKRRGLLLLVAFLFFTSIYVIRIREDMADFQVNYQAGSRLLAGENLYRTEDGHFMFKYLPFSALLYLPLSLIPLEVAKAIWYVVLVASTIAVFALSKRLASRDENARAGLVVFPAVILAKFFLREMKLGQINILVTLTLLGMLWFLASRRPEPNRAGFLWGLATSLKPYGMIFLPYFLVRKQWKALAAGGATILAALLLPSLFYGFTGNLDQLREWASTLSQSTPTLLRSNDNVSIAAFFMKWTHRPELSGLLGTVAIGALAFLVLLVLRARDGVERPTPLEGALLLTLIPLVSPLGWDYTLLMSILAITILVKNYSQYSRPAQLLLVANFCVISLSIYDLVGARYYGVFMEWSILTVAFLIVVGYLVSLRFQRLA